MRFYRFVIWSAILYSLYWGYQNFDTVIYLADNAAQKVDKISQYLASNKPAKTEIARVRPEQKSIPASASKTKQSSIESKKLSQEKAIQTPQSLKSSRESTEEPAITAPLSMSDKPPIFMQNDAPKMHQFNELSNITNQPTDRVLTPTIKSIQSDAYQKLLNDAHNAIASGDFSAAVSLYQSLLRQQPKNPRTWGELGDVFHFQNRIELAAKAYGNAVYLLRQSDSQSHTINQLMAYIQSKAPEVGAILRKYP